MTIVVREFKRAAMFKGARSRGSARNLLAVLFSLALALRVIVPTGFMPTQTAQGMVVGICDGMGSTKTVVIDLQRSSDDEQKPDHQKQATPCAFTALSASAFAADLPAALNGSTLPRREFVPPSLPKVASPLRADFLIPPLRGPPALA